MNAFEKGRSLLYNGSPFLALRGLGLPRTRAREEEVILEPRKEGQPPEGTQKPEEFSLRVAKAQPTKVERSQEEILALETHAVSICTSLSTHTFCA